MEDPLPDPAVHHPQSKSCHHKSEAVDGAGDSKGEAAHFQRDELRRGSSSGKFLKEFDAELNAPDKITDDTMVTVEARVEEDLPDQENLKIKGSHVGQKDCCRLFSPSTWEANGYDLAMTEDDLIRRGREIFFQAFNWESSKQRWWNLLEGRVDELASWGFTSLWLPPAWDSLAPQGYLPRDLYSLNTAYGSDGELRGLLRRINERGIRAMADIVINHRIGSCQGYGGLYNRYDGMPMPWDEHAVTCDTGGLGNPKTGVIFEGVPNIDHTQEFVRNDLKSWMRWLRNDLGFKDFRFDFSKGYAPRFVREFIDAVQPYMSIGEYWDSCRYVGPDYALDYNQDAHRQRTVNWVDGCSGAACAFDFTTKAILQEAVGKKQWWRLRDGQGRPPGVIGMWPSRAVTFVDNHDTGSTQRFWPFPSNHVVQGYAYILTHPGQPCVFWDHLYDWGGLLRDEILRMIAIRKRQDIHSRSKVEILEANNNVYAAMIDQKVCMKMGDGDWCPSWGNWELATSGQSYAIWQKSQRLLPA